MLLTGTAIAVAAQKAITIFMAYQTFTGIATISAMGVKKMTSGSKKYEIICRVGEMHRRR